MPPMRMEFGTLSVCWADSRNEDGNARSEKSIRDSGVCSRKLVERNGEVCNNSGDSQTRPHFHPQDDTIFSSTCGFFPHRFKIMFFLFFCFLGPCHTCGRQVPGAG